MPLILVLGSTSLACTVEPARPAPAPEVTDPAGTEPPRADQTPLASPFMKPCDVFDEKAATLIEPTARGAHDESLFGTFSICLRNADSTKPAATARFDRMTTEVFRARVCTGRDHPVEIIEGLGEAACVWKIGGEGGDVQLAAVKNGTSVLLGTGSLDRCQTSMDYVLQRLDTVARP